MATPLSSGQALRAAKSTGHRVVQLSGWATHNRNHKGAWGPANGVMVHHTGSDTSAPAAYATNVLHDGYSGLPGPLCQFGIDADGVIYMIGWGRANHAGRGDDAVLGRVMQEDQRLMSSEAQPTRRDTDGNTRFYGIEVMYSGGHRMTGPQREATVRLSAALCAAHGWGAASVIGHREWSTTKWDPGQESMTTMRRSIAAVLAGHMEWDGELFPGNAAFALGVSGDWVTLLGERLVAHGFGDDYKVGPGPTMGPADVAAVQKAQKSWGWPGDNSTHPVGIRTWERLTADPPKPEPASPDRVSAIRAQIAELRAELDRLIEGTL